MVAQVAAAPTMFLQRLQTSRLLDAERIDAAVKAVGSDEKTLAAYLLRDGLLTRFQVRQLFAGATSFHVDKYVVLDCLGRGGTGIVYKARHGLMPNRYVALKTVDWHDLHRSEEALARFRREIDIVARLDHPNVVRAFDVIHTRTQLYLVLEYVEGRDLGSLVKERGKLPVPEAVGYAVQAARGLAYAHRCGIVHRDIKPGNLLLTRDGVVKLSDLGLARRHAQDEAIDLTKKGIWLGTPEFMAPEQAEDAGMADARSDIYSLGATLFHLLTAELPLNGSSQFHCLTKLLMEAPRPLRDVLPDAPPELAAIVDRLRARELQKRPATADEVIALLEPFLRKAALRLRSLRPRSSGTAAARPMWSWKC
jgi:serine/threonine-protein kinase